MSISDEEVEERVFEIAGHWFEIKKKLEEASDYKSKTKWEEKKEALEQTIEEYIDNNPCKEYQGVLADGPNAIIARVTDNFRAFEIARGRIGESTERFVFEYQNGTMVTQELIISGVWNYLRGAYLPPSHDFRDLYQEKEEEAKKFIRSVLVDEAELRLADLDLSVREKFFSRKKGVSFPIRRYDMGKKYSHKRPIYDFSPTKEILTTAREKLGYSIDNVVAMSYLTHDDITSLEGGRCYTPVILETYVEWLESQGVRFNQDLSIDTWTRPDRKNTRLPIFEDDDGKWVDAKALKGARKKLGIDIQTLSKLIGSSSKYCIESWEKGGPVSMDIEQCWKFFITSGINYDGKDVLPARTAYPVPHKPRYPRIKFNDITQFGKRKDFINPNQFWKARKSLGWSTDEASEQTGIDENIILKIETGREPDISNVKRYYRKLEKAGVNFSSNGTGGPLLRYYSFSRFDKVERVSLLQLGAARRALSLSEEYIISKFLISKRTLVGWEKGQVGLKSRAKLIDYIEDMIDQGIIFGKREESVKVFFSKDIVS